MKKALSKSPAALAGDDIWTMGVFSDVTAAECGDNILVAVDGNYIVVDITVHNFRFIKI
jgi:hypothetical protein